MFGIFRDHMKKTRKEGFTLVEVLVVVAILVLLAGIAVPQLFRAFEEARLQKLEIDARQVLSAMDRAVLQDQLNGVSISSISRTEYISSVLSTTYGINVTIPPNTAFYYEYTAGTPTSSAYGVVEVVISPGGKTFSTYTGEWK